ncbi:MAG: hypothetical protein ACRDVE_17705, partial [Actinocrinis sp.]
LRRDGWGVLPSAQLRSGSDIDHVVVGPPGVFTIDRESAETVARLILPGAHGPDGDDEVDELSRDSFRD